MTLATTGANGTGTVLRGWNYDTQNRAVEVYKGTTPASAALRTRWDYDAGGARFRRTDDGTAGPNSSTLYLGNVERVTTGANVTWRRTIAGVAVMALVGVNPSLPTTNFLLHDHIGSIVAVANTSGALVERGDYSAFGGMRTTLSGVSVGLAALTTTTRGFTGHEQLGSLDLIHMNGRIYDPALGRFLQADPMVAEPGNPQNWNPYSYVFNNPLVNTDPTGMISIRQIFGTVVAVVFAIITQDYLHASQFIAALFTSAAGGFLSSVIATGNLQQGILGAFEAVVTLGIGSSGWGVAERIGANALTGGVVSVLEGGKFGNGFVSAGLTAFAMPYVRGNVVAKAVDGAIIGGTVSKLTGGKFADGAITGAVEGAMTETPTGKDTGKWLTPAGKSTDLNAYWTFETPGIWAGSEEEQQAKANTTQSPVFYNPSEGRVQDVFESISQKFFGWAGDKLAEGFAQGLSRVDHTFTVTAHSQGELTVTNAAQYYGLQVNGNSFDMRSGAGSYFTAQHVFATGSLTWSMPYGDIANLYSGTINPVRWLSGFHDVFCGACTHISNGLERH